MSNNSNTVLLGDGIEFDWDKLQTVPDDCYLVALGQREISVLLSCVRFAEARHLWRWSDTATWVADVEPWVQELKGALLMGCNVNDIVTALNNIEAAIRNQNPAFATGQTSNDVLDGVASASGVSALWDGVKVGLAAYFPEAAIPISVGLDIIRNLVDNSVSNEAETAEIAKMLGSTASLPD